MMKRVAYWVVAVVVGVVAVSVGANAWLGGRGLRVHPPAGSFYTVDGTRMHLDCEGAGSPTVILEAGLGDDGLQWRKVQPALAKLTRVCSYDRAGYGWSEVRGGTRDSAAITGELHALLQQAGITGDVVLMGHSAGGLHIRTYATKYPEGVKGLVFVDASTPGQFNELPAELTAADDLRWPKVETFLGIPRWRGECGQHEWTGKGTVESDTAQEVEWMKADDCLVSVLTTTEAEEAAFPLSGQEAEKTGPFGDTPILIFSEDTDFVPAFWLQFYSADLHAQFAKTWIGLQEGLKGLSTRSQRIVAKKSSHYVQVDRPEVVIAHVSEMIRMLQGSGAAPAAYGTTTVE